MCTKPSSNFQSYFNDGVYFRGNHRNVNVHRKRMLEDSARLFKGRIDMSVLSSAKTLSTRTLHSTIKSLDDLTQVWQVCSPSYNAMLYRLTNISAQQDNSNHEFT